MKKIISVVGARPNFMKVAPLHKEFKKYEINHLICHTGQHFDQKMSTVFFDELEMPKPDFFLGIGGGSHAEQTAKIMIEFEKILIKEQPDLVIVVGDVNSTIACTITAVKLHIKVVHVEAGLRSFDRSMPEEINRLVTDVLADYLFVTEESGLTNLKHEGIADSKVFFSGNIMIDSLVNYTPKIEASTIFEKYHLEKGNYLLVTFHRPSNVDSAESLIELVSFLNAVGETKKVIFPIHPRTSQNLERFGLSSSLNKNIILTEPIGYIDFQALVRYAELIVTDSGGIQEESTYLGVQCITVRDNTERPSTVSIGTNQLIGTDLVKVAIAVKDVLGGKLKVGKIPELWDGRAAERICKKIVELLG